MATRARRARRRSRTQRSCASRADRSMTAEAWPRTPRRGGGRRAERADADRPHKPPAALRAPSTTRWADPARDVSASPPGGPAPEAPKLRPRAVTAGLDCCTSTYRVESEKAPRNISEVPFRFASGDLSYFGLCLLTAHHLRTVRVKTMVLGVVTWPRLLFRAIFF